MLTLTKTEKNPRYFAKGQRHRRDGTFMPAVLGNDIFNEFNIISFNPNKHPIKAEDKRNFWIYQDGVYVQDKSCETLKHAIKEKLQSYAKKRYISYTLTALYERCTYDTWKHLEHTKREDILIHEGYINFKNCLYEIETGTTHPHTPEFISLIQLPVTYNPDATCPKIDNFLDDILNGDTDAIKEAHQWIAEAIMQERRESMKMLVGPEHTGKRTFMSIIQHLLGEQNVSRHAYAEIARLKDRPWCFGKLANMDAPETLTSSTLNSLTLRSIIDGYTKDVYFYKAYRYTPRATLFCSCTTIPKGLSENIKWRLSILNFDNQHLGAASKGSEYIKRLTTPNELSGILNHAIAAIRRMQQKEK